MKGSLIVKGLMFIAALMLCSCSNRTGNVFDILIINGMVFNGEDSEPQPLMVGISGSRVAFIGEAEDLHLSAHQTIDAAGKWVIPGFIDPHTHSFSDLLTDKKDNSLNNLAQGVTTAFYGNDGYGSPYIAEQLNTLKEQGIGLNVALFAGHGEIRSIVMGRENRKPFPAELSQMKVLLRQAMDEGALGLSTGLFYVPGTYANTDEVVSLAEVAAAQGGVYESHIRDESNYNIGVVAAIEEVIEIARRADIPAHIAHIKALGVDVWGKSAEIIQLIEQAQREGLAVTADQYPWRASGIKIHKALMPNWALEGLEADIQQRLKDPLQLPKIKKAMVENLRRRGGPDSLLIVLSADPALQGKTLAQLADQWQIEPVDAVLRILSLGVIEPWTRVASFNMHPQDIEAFMVKPWVMTSSDGTSGHPRKYASFPQKYRDYVIGKKLLTPQAFIHRSSGLVADTFSVENRGYIRLGYFADIAIINPEEYRPSADFRHWNTLAEGVDYLLVNGRLTIDKGVFTESLNGLPLRRK